MVNKIYLSWNEFDRMIDRMSSFLSCIKFDGIYGMPRGGLPIAVCLSHRLKLPLLVTPTINTLVVDDISDTGETLHFIKNKMITCLYSSKWTITHPDVFCGKKLNKEDWIVFPWEV